MLLATHTINVELNGNYIKEAIYEEISKWDLMAKCGALKSHWLTITKRMYNKQTNGLVGSELWQFGGRLNIKILSYQYRDAHDKDKTVQM